MNFHYTLFLRMLNYFRAVQHVTGTAGTKGLGTTAIGHCRYCRHLMAPAMLPPDDIGTAVIQMALVQLSPDVGGTAPTA